MKNHSKSTPCNEWVEQLATLSPTESEELSAHLMSCEACAAVKREYDEIDRLIDNLTCSEALSGLPSQLLQLWKEQHDQISQHFSESYYMPKQISRQIVGDFSNTAVIPFSSYAALETLSLSTLADRCMSEIEKYRHKEPYNNQYCLEIFYRAMVKHDSDAWEILHRQFSPLVRTWMRNHPQRDIAYALQAEENYVDEAFHRLWQASVRNSLKFDSTAAALRYLKSCLQGAVIDNLRAYSRTRELPLPDPVSDTHYMEEPAIEDDYERNDLWEAIKSLLPNERERRLAYLLYINGLKARDIVRFCPQEFGDIQEVYRLTRNITERLTRHRDQIRWRLG
jgi:DNA-directed RNA polymerase specialized sigma24 family protein